MALDPKTSTFDQTLEAWQDSVSRTEGAYAAQDSTMQSAMADMETQLNVINNRLSVVVDEESPSFCTEEDASITSSASSRAVFRLTHALETLAGLSRGAAVAGTVATKLVELSPGFQHLLQTFGEFLESKYVTEEVTEANYVCDNILMPYLQKADVSSSETDNSAESISTLEFFVHALNDCDAAIINLYDKVDLKVLDSSILTIAAAAFANEGKVEGLINCVNAFCKNVPSTVKATDLDTAIRLIRTLIDVHDAADLPLNQQSPMNGARDLLGILLMHHQQHALAVREFANEILLQDKLTSNTDTANAEQKFIRHACRALTTSRAALSLLHVGQAEAARELMLRSVKSLGGYQSPRLLRNLAVIELNLVTSTLPEHKNYSTKAKLNPLIPMRQAVAAAQNVVESEKARMENELKLMEQVLLSGAQQSAAAASTDDINRWLKEQNFSFDSNIYADEPPF